MKQVNESSTSEIANDRKYISIFDGYSPSELHKHFIL